MRKYALVWYTKAYLRWGNSMVFTFENVSNLIRKNDDVYFIVLPLGAIKDWGFPVIQSDVIGEDVILVNYDTVVSLINNKLQVTNPGLLINCLTAA